ncbi:phosphatidylethanolamine-binding protein [Russula brevipes]|nr:phosphatidylethanolamine-binding protein [Russula brevipes]
MYITFDPIVLLEVTFPRPDGTTVNISAGGQLPQNVTAGPPQFSLSCDRGSDMRPGPFVVAAVDLDAPTPQLRNVSQIRHFLGGGFQLGARSDQDVWPLANTTPVSTEWVQPQPPQGSDPHRYVFLVFDESPGYANQTLVDSSTSRLFFNMSDFAAKTQLGNPLGGTFMLVGPASTA